MSGYSAMITSTHNQGLGPISNMNNNNNAKYTTIGSIHNNLDMNDITGSLFLDLCKAFDTAHYWDSLHILSFVIFSFTFP